jgi:hypothetical protein
VSRLNELAVKLTTIKSLQSNAQHNLQKLVEESATLTNTVDMYNSAVELCNHCIADQIKIKNYLEEITTSFLNTVLIDLEDESASIPRLRYILEPVIDESGLTTGIKPLVVEEGSDPEPISEYGESVANLIGLVNRIVPIAMNPNLRPVVIGDEMCVNLNPKVWGHVVGFIRDLQKTLGEFQLIVVSHSGIQFPTTYKIVKRGDTSYAYPDTSNEYLRTA